MKGSTNRFDLTMSVLGAWLLGGIFTDGWAHNHIHVESFFTPWHAVLYSGFLANAGFFAATMLRAHRKGDSWRKAVPVGFELTGVGVIIFGLSGIGDLTWHLIFGIETSVSAGFSPPHLGIMIGTGLIVSGPFLAAWKRSNPPAGWIEWLPVLLSLTLALSLMTFVTQYASPLVVISASVKPLRFHNQVIGAVSLLLHTAILMGWLLIAMTRWKLPSVSVTFIFSLNAIAMSLMRDKFFLIPAIVLAGLAADLWLWKLSDTRIGRHEFRLIALLIPIFYSLLYFGAVQIHEGITWPTPLWTGSALMTGIVSVLLSYLMLPAPFPRSAASPLRN